MKSLLKIPGVFVKKYTLADSKIYIEIQRIQNSQNNLEKQAELVGLHCLISRLTP